MIATVVGSVGFPSRSPHGERGLKLSHVRHAYAGMNVALLMESVD